MKYEIPRTRRPTRPWVAGSIFTAFIWWLNHCAGCPDPTGFEIMLMVMVAGLDYSLWNYRVIGD